MSVRNSALLARAVAGSYSIRGALQKLGLAPAGGNYETIKKAIREFGLDTSHFTGQGTCAERLIRTAPARYERSSFAAGWNKRLALNGGCSQRV